MRAFPVLRICPHMPNWVGFGVTKPSYINSSLKPRNMTSLVRERDVAMQKGSS
mgnify:CR=1